MKVWAFFFLVLLGVAAAADAEPTKTKATKKPKPTPAEILLEKIGKDTQNFAGFRMDKVYLFKKGADKKFMGGNKIVSIHLTDDDEAKKTKTGKKIDKKQKKINRLVVWIGLNDHAEVDTHSKFTQVADSEDVQKHELKNAKPLSGPIRVFVEDYLLRAAKNYALTHPTQGDRAAHDLWQYPTASLVNTIWGMGMKYSHRKDKASLTIKQVLRHQFNPPTAQDDLFELTAREKQLKTNSVTKVVLTKNEQNKPVMQCRITGDVNALPRQLQVNFLVEDSTPPTTINRIWKPISATVQRLISKGSRSQYYVPPKPVTDKKKKDAKKEASADVGFVLIPGLKEKIDPEVFFQVSARLYHLCMNYVTRGSSVGSSQFESNWAVNDIVSDHGAVSWSDLEEKFMYPSNDDLTSMFGSKKTPFKSVLVRSVKLRNNAYDDKLFQVKQGKEIVCQLQGGGVHGRVVDLFLSLSLNKDKEITQAITRHYESDTKGILIKHKQYPKEFELVLNACLNYAEEYDTDDLFYTSFNGIIRGRPVLVRRAAEYDFP